MVPLVSGNLSLVSDDRVHLHILDQIQTLLHDHVVVETTTFQVAGKMTLTDCISGQRPLKLVDLLSDRNCVCIYIGTSFPTSIIHSIDCGGGELGRGETNTLVGSVEDRVESFQEGKAIDEVKAFAGI